MASSRRRQAKARSSTSSSTSASRRSRSAVSKEKASHEIEKSASSSFALEDVVSPQLLTQTLLVLSALVAVKMELISSSSYLHHQELIRFLRKSFMFLVCLSCHLQFAPLVADPPGLKRLQWRRVVWRHSVILASSILANCAGTTVIQPLFGHFPMYHATTQQVLPVYFLLQALLFVGVPVPLLQAVAGLFVSWFKAMSMTTLVLQWNSLSKHPVAFVLVCSANLCASTWMIQFLAHCHRSGPAWKLSRGFAVSLLQMLGTSSIVGVIALVADSRARTLTREREVFVLYFLIAWFSLDRYFKRSLTYFLSSSLSNKKAL